MAFSDTGKLEILIPNLVHKINRSKIGDKHNKVNKFETNAGGRFSGSRNIC
jgi:hypothetical protein